LNIQGYKFEIINLENKRMNIQSLEIEMIWGINFERQKLIDFELKEYLKSQGMKLKIIVPKQSLNVQAVNPTN